jgi:hypothetical protein
MINLLQMGVESIIQPGDQYKKELMKDRLRKMIIEIIQTGEIVRSTQTGGIAKAISKGCHPIDPGRQDKEKVFMETKGESHHIDQGSTVSRKVQMVLEMKDRTILPQIRVLLADLTLEGDPFLEGN